MLRRTRSILVVVGLTLVAAVAAGLAGARTNLAKVVVRVGDSSLSLSPKSVPAGKVELIVRNVGKKAHTFGVGSRSTGVIKPGKSKTLIVTFTKGGTQRFHVTLYRGRTVTLKVVPPKKGGSATSASDVAAGKGLFKANCASCHTLAAAGAKGTVGPNLDTLKLTLTKIEGQVTNGGRFMPPFGASAGGSLSAAQVKDVSEFVYQAQH